MITIFIFFYNHNQAKIMNGIPQTTIKEEDYGEVYHETILNILGDELTYNELKFYAKSKCDTSYLTTKYESYNHNKSYWFSVFINNELVLEKHFGSHYSCDMFIFLEELRLQKEDEDEDEEEDDDMREHKHKMNKVFMVITTAKKYMDKLTPDESISKFMKLRLCYFDALIT